MTGTPIAQPRIRIPRTARAGEAIEIRTLIEHPTESGIRGANPAAVPRNMLGRLVVRMNGETVFAADLGNGTSANPYHVFFVRVPRTRAPPVVCPAARAGPPPPPGGGV